jgi:Uncharacterized conserved protein (COG2071)
MRLPHLQGIIERRLLVNYRVDPDVAAHLLPDPFRPQLVDDVAVAGICLLRLGAMRPQGLPRWFGLRSENAAHRIAVEWDTPDGPRTGVYIPRRDSASVTNAIVGGRLYPGVHEPARFGAIESAKAIHVAFTSRDGSASVDVAATLTDELSDSVLFPDTQAASRFFERGSDGYSATRHPRRFDGLRLETTAWQVRPLIVERVQSSFFEDDDAFPPGAAILDSALVMLDVPVTWTPLEPLRAEGRSPAPV